MSVMYSMANPDCSLNSSNTYHCTGRSGGLHVNAMVGFLTRAPGTRRAGGGCGVHPYGPGGSGFGLAQATIRRTHAARKKERGSGRPGEATPALWLRNGGSGARRGTPFRSPMGQEQAVSWLSHF